MALRLAAIAAVCVAAALADCPDACSGAGLCVNNEQCKCDPGFFGHNCAQRLCPHAKAWVDVPAGDLNHDGVVSATTYVSRRLTGHPDFANTPQSEMFPVSAADGGFEAQPDEAHFYMECAGAGTCDRALGACKCNDGYTGAACQRSACANGCSGKGRCRTLKDIASGALNRRAVGSVGGNMVFEGVQTAFDYTAWDADMNQACVCDAGYQGADCSKRTCPMGSDPLLRHAARWCGGEPCASEVQEFTLSSAGPTTYRISFTDASNKTAVAYATVNTATGIPGAVNDAATELPAPQTNAGIIMAALRGVPGNMLQDVEVIALGQTNDASGRTFRVTFVGLAGDQYLLEVAPAAGPGVVASAPREFTRGNTPSTECSSRGTCNEDTGVCKCFSGFVGGACQFQHAVSGPAAATQ